MHVAFNQDASCCVAGSAQGFRVYNCSPFGKFYSSDELTNLGGVGIAQMLLSTSLVAIVGNGELSSPRRLAVVNTRRRANQAIVCELTFPTSVRNLRLNRQRLVVILDSQIYVYNIANMKLLYTLDTVANRSGIAEVTPNLSVGKVTSKSSSSLDQSSDVSATNESKAENETDITSTSSTKLRDNWLVYPAGPPTKHHLSPPKGASEVPHAPQGDVVVFDMDSLAPVTVIHAHRSPVVTLALNEDGSLLATTSAKGTLVRVFAVPSGTLLYELRRGSYQSRVFDIAFSLGSKLLCVTSATQTVHVYKLDAANRVSATGAESLTKQSGRGGRDRGAETGDQIAPTANYDNDVDQTNKGDSENEGDMTTDSVGSGLEADTSNTAGESNPLNAHKKKNRWFSAKWVKPALKQRNQKRDFAWFKLPLKPGTRTKLGIAPLSNMVYVATETGKLFHYAIDMEKGGECRKINEYLMD